MKKNNIYNTIFHRSEILNNKRQIQKCLLLYTEGPQILNEITNSTSLVSLLNIHKDAWGTGFQNNNLGPCSYGMFRTENISNMLPGEVFLGDIYGLFTHPISYWEEVGNQPLNYFAEDKTTTVYDVILKQYKGILFSNIENLYHNAKEKLYEFRLCGYKF